MGHAVCQILFRYATILLFGFLPHLAVLKVLLFLALDTGITFGGFGEQCRMPGIGPYLLYYRSSPLLQFIKT